MRRFVKVEHKLGAGYYGVVFRGVLNEDKIGGRPAYPVAVKVCRENATAQDRENLLEEAAIMAQFSSHPNVSAMGLCGLVIVQGPNLCVPLFRSTITLDCCPDRCGERGGAVDAGHGALRARELGRVPARLLQPL
jgi:hypothetical protein